MDRQLELAGHWWSYKYKDSGALRVEAWQGTWQLTNEQGGNCDPVENLRGKLEVRSEKLLTADIAFFSLHFGDLNTFGSSCVPVTFPVIKKNSSHPVHNPRARSFPSSKIHIPYSSPTYDEQRVQLHRLLTIVGKSPLNPFPV